VIEMNSAESAGGGVYFSVMPENEKFQCTGKKWSWILNEVKGETTGNGGYGYDKATSPHHLR